MTVPHRCWGLHFTRWRIVRCGRSWQHVHRGKYRKHVSPSGVEWEV